MTVTLHRLDAVFSATCDPPGMALVGNAPDAIKKLYSVFTGRYPGTPVSNFRALNSNQLNEIGVGVSLMGGRLQLDFRVDQVMGKVTNLQTPQEVAFAQDALLLAGVVAKQLYGEAVSLSNMNLRLSSWLNYDKGKSGLLDVFKSFENANKSFPASSIGASEVVITPWMELSNPNEKWKLAIAVEKSAVEQADLFLVRDFTFGGDVLSIEARLRFIAEASAAVLDWLGVGKLEG